MVQVGDLAEAAEETEEPRRLEKPTLLAKYQIPVQHLDFEYVEKCNDGKELEKILHILKSGQEGFYPQLMEATEKKLTEIKPNSKLLRKVCPVLMSNEINQDEWNGLSNDLKEWVQDVNKKDNELEERKLTSIVDVVNSDIRKTQDKCIPIPNNKPNSKRIKSTDYESWDKYDPDTEILKMDLEVEKLKKEVCKKQTEHSKKSKTVRFNTFATEAEAIFEANREKERGNECFKAGEFITAVQHYSNSLECKPLAAVYTNRALVYNKLKKYELAINDCKQALKLEPRNFKAYLRMAQSYDFLEQHEQALKNAEIAIEIDPNNTLVQQLANRMRKECGETINNKRFTIQDVNTTETSSPKPTLKPILKSPENNSKTPNQGLPSKDNETKSADDNSKTTDLPSKNKEVKVTANNSQVKDLQKKCNKVKNTENSKIKKQDYEVISIPGSSKMPPPFYKVVHSKDPEVIKWEKQKIFNRPRLLHITTIDVTSDDEDNRDLNENNEILCDKTIEIIKQTLPQINDNNIENYEIEKFKFDNENTVKTKAVLERKPLQHINSQDRHKNLDNKRAGGEPYNDIHENIIPTTEELQSPYTFIITWNSIRKDTTYKQHAQLLRNLDLERLHEVIGYKLDDTMLSNIITCLHKHFTVPGELDRLHAILSNITRIPRFKMMLMFLNQSDLQSIRQLIQFLDQHGRNLPSNIRSIYTNN